MREVGKKIPVIVVTELPGEFSLLYGVAETIDVPGLNEHSLKICASTLGTEELYLRNDCEALSSGVFWANKDFHNNYIEKRKMVMSSLSRIIILRHSKSIMMQFRFIASTTMTSAQWIVFLESFFILGASLVSYMVNGLKERMQIPI